MSKKTPNGMGNLFCRTRNGKKYWTGRVTLGYDLNGEQIRKSFSGYKKAEVVEKMQRALSTTAVAGYVDKGEQLLGDHMGYWLYNIKAKEIKSTTLARYDSLYRLRIKENPYAKIKVREINILNLQGYIDKLIADGNSRNVVKSTLSLIKLFMEYAVSVGMTQTNPTKYIKLPRKTEAPKDNEKYRIFSRTEQDEIINALNLDDPVEAMIYVGFFSGLRKSEMRGLKWKSYADGSLQVEKQLRREYDFDGEGKKSLDKNAISSLKTEASRRTVPLPDIADNFLKEYKEKCEIKHQLVGDIMTDESFIFSDYELKPIEEKRPNRRLQYICKQIGIPPRPFHSIRHSYATRLFEGGVDIKTVQHLMGHRDYKTTLDIYTHVMPEQKEKAVKVFDNMYK